ncbi:HMG box [Dictyocaulus viviparus]|uniref:HMG box n=1 Tax=Dictyocaulus viviparus TaxID=29172 RepID=A0A0D8XW35_DICVI|nr:HMG box [Dictyocaulus viviparus]
MSLSSRSSGSGSGSRAASPEDENMKTRSDSPALSIIMKQDRYADLKRRSAQAFTVFANEEREKLMKTHPDLPMGLVTRMMVEKWKTLDNEARKPYFESSRNSSIKAKKTAEDLVSGIIPAKKPCLLASYTPSGHSVYANENAASLESSSEQPGRIVIVQGKVATSMNDAVKTNSSSMISATIAQALGVTVTPQKTTQTQVAKHAMPPPVRTSSLRARTSSTPIVSTQEMNALPTSLASSNGDSHKRITSACYGFSSSQQALDMFYLALCEPAFPHPNEPPLTPYPANYCYDAYLRMTSGQNGVV